MIHRTLPPTMDSKLLHSFRCIDLLNITRPNRRGLPILFFSYFTPVPSLPRLCLCSDSISSRPAMPTVLPALFSCALARPDSSFRRHGVRAQDEVLCLDHPNFRPARAEPRWPALVPSGLYWPGLVGTGCRQKSKSDVATRDLLSARDAARDAGSVMCSPKGVWCFYCVEGGS